MVTSQPVPALSGTPQELADGEDYLVSVTVSGSFVIYPRDKGSPFGFPVALGQGYVFSGHSVRAIAIDTSTACEATICLGVSNSAPPVRNVGGNVALLAQNAIGVLITNPVDDAGLSAIGFAAGGNAPITGEFFGFANALAAGAVAVGGLVLGTATGAGQIFSFRMFVTRGSFVSVTNCNTPLSGIRP